MSSTTSSRCLSVADVYDIAADIGKEFEVAIDAQGADHLGGLMQKVICALEHLERSAAAADAESDTLEQLRTTVSHLEREEAKRHEERQRVDRELEQLEEHYKQETRDLLATVKRLQDDNRKLSSSLAAATERDSAFSEDENYLEVDLVRRMQGESEKQRAHILRLDQALLDLRASNDELCGENERLANCNRDLRRKCRGATAQMHEMVDERAQLAAQLHDSHRELQTLKTHLNRAERECHDLSLGAAAEEPADAPREVGADKSAADGGPKFTLPELKEILHERNALKARVSDLEDELAVYRPGSRDKSASSTQPGSRVRLSVGPAPKCDCSYHSEGKDSDGGVVVGGGGAGGGRGRHLASVESDEDASATAAPDTSIEEGGREEAEEEEEELAVHGPMPEEPEDAPWRRRNNEESGIRKLFSYITNRVSSVSHQLVSSAEQELRMGNSSTTNPNVVAATSLATISRTEKE